MPISWFSYDIYIVDIVYNICKRYRVYRSFINNKTSWVHLDIAGMAFSKKAANLNPSGATGFGVRLLNKLIEDSYE